MSKSVDFEAEFVRDHQVIKNRIKILTMNFHYGALVRSPVTVSKVLESMAAADKALQQAYDLLFGAR